MQGGKQGEKKRRRREAGGKLTALLFAPSSPPPPLLLSFCFLLLLLLLPFPAVLLPLRALSPPVATRKGSGPKTPVPDSLYNDVSHGHTFRDFTLKESGFLRKLNVVKVLLWGQLAAKPSLSYSENSAAPTSFLPQKLSLLLFLPSRWRHQPMRIGWSFFRACAEGKEDTWALSLF